ncbi:cytochrome P450 4c3 [Halyomorpha halys]|uniref:cytochrome P450 4c3 n=1 Tax=Halyomorpha halys TaxID=286706 RepID=UPI0034D259E2
MTQVGWAGHIMRMDESKILKNDMIEQDELAEESPTGGKSSHWSNHRKLITPAFHFKILEKFIPTFNANIDIYLRKLDEKAEKGSFNIENYIAYLALDIIAEGKERVALLDLLLETQRRSSEFTDKDILDEVNTFMFGGHDTITSCINFTFYFLAKNPGIQEEVLREVQSVVGEENFTLSNLQQLKYLERVIKESLRILPVAPFIQRAAKKDIKLRSGYILPAGSTIIMMIYALHQNPQYYPNPQQFDPDRFLPENCVKRNSYAYIPFSAGHRNCIGQKFALLEIKAVIAATVRRYKLLPSEDIKPVVHIILRSANGINLILERRNSSPISDHQELQT